MVEVVPPEGWQPEAELPLEAAGSEAAAGEAAEGTGPASGATVAAGVDTEVAGPPRLWASPTGLAWRKWLLWGAVPAAGLVVMVGVCSMFFWPERPQEEARSAVEQPAEPAPVGQPPLPKEQPPPPPSQVDRRWLPDGTALYFSLRPSRLAGEPGFGQVVGQLGEQWQQTVGAVLESLGLKPEVIRRLTWASTDLAAWPEQSVVLIELEQSHDAASWAALGEAVDLGLAGAACRRLPGGTWKHPFAVIDRQTIVTGQVELLRQLAGRKEGRLESATIERLLPLAASDPELTLLVDLAAARKAHWRLPTAVLDVWPPGKQPWHVIWETSVGLGCRLLGSDRFRSELVLVCEGETAAEKVQAAVDELIPAAKKWLSAELEGVSAKLKAGQMTATAAANYGSLLNDGLAAADAAQRKVVDGSVWVWVDWGRGPSAVASSAIDSRAAIQAAWLTAAREADEAQHRRLLAGLHAYQQAEGRFPAAAADAARLSTEERLSWIATMLPFYGYQDWHRQLDSGQAWNGPQNRPIAQRPLPEVVNPALAPAQTEAGFPVTYYVGVAGVGVDAGRLKADDPRAGVFGQGRQTRPEDIADGAANTIALLGVTKGLGPWAAGGAGTVRGLTKPPYVNGPDGFGSGQPDGMLAGMADGSVRFISKDIDPRVLEQLATINGEGIGDRGEGLGDRGQRPGARGHGPEATGQGPGDRGQGTGPSGEGPGVATSVATNPRGMSGQGPKPEESPEEVVPKKREGQSPPVEVDVAARLADAVPEIQLRGVPLAEAVDLLAGLSTVPISFDPEAMQQLGVSLHDPVTVELSGATVGEILQKVASSRGLAAVVEEGQMLVTSPPDRRERLWPRRYTVSDLTGEDPAGVAELAAVIGKLVAPDSWRPSGGRGTIEPEGDALAVVQTGVVHDEILTFCEKLRNARDKPLRSRQSPQRFTLATRLDRAKAALDRPVTANFHEPTPLIEVLAYLGRLAETDILVDRLALKEAGLSDRADARVTAEKQPLGETLRGLLGPLGLECRVIDAKTLQVTTRKAVAARLELEFYPVNKLLANGRTGAALVEQIKGRLAGSTWSDAGGPGVLHFDQPSSCLIVLQSQPVQGELARLLGELRN